jgi:hypothetical protein
MHDIRELVASRFYVQELYTWECIYEIRRPTEVVLEGLRFDWFGQLNAMRVNASNVFSNADMALDTPVPKKYRSGPLAVPIYGPVAGTARDRLCKSAFPYGVQSRTARGQVWRRAHRRY